MTDGPVNPDFSAPEGLGGGQSAPPPLCPADGAALDALLGARAMGVDVAGGAGPMPAEASDRAPGVRGLLSLLDRMPEAEGPDGAHPPADLSRRTIDAVAEARQRERFAEQVQAFAQGPRAVAFSWRQLGAAAAAVILGVAMLIPVLNNNQQQAQQIACRSNLGSVGQAFMGYAASNRGALPRYQVQPGAVWWNVGSGAGDGPVQSNASHLLILMHENLVRLEQLACPSRGDAATGSLIANQRDWSRPEAVSYSYQNQYRAEATKLELNPKLIILADKNPLLRTRSDGTGMFHDTSVALGSVSEAHGDDGHNLLLADGSARWAFRTTHDTGRHGADNMWTPVGAEPGQALQGTELPESSSFDSFLVP
ncbi:MAG: hypothetical protein AAGA57_09215 [Planctomycetota bacterium]